MNQQTPPKLQQLLDQEHIQVRDFNRTNYINFKQHSYRVTVDFEFLQVLQHDEYLTNSHISFFTNLFQSILDQEKSVLITINKVLILDPYFYSDFVPNSTIQFTQNMFVQSIDRIESKPKSSIINKNNLLQIKTSQATDNQNNSHSKISPKPISQQTASKQFTQNMFVQSIDTIESLPKSQINTSQQTQQDIDNKKQSHLQIGPKFISQSASSLQGDCDRSYHKSPKQKQTSMTSQPKQQVAAKKIPDQQQVNKKIPYQSNSINQPTNMINSNSNSQISEDKNLQNNNSNPNQSQYNTQSQSQTKSSEQSLFDSSRLINQTQYQQFPDTTQAIQNQVESQEYSDIQLVGSIIIENNFFDTTNGPQFSAISSRLNYLNRFYACSSENPVREKEFTYIPINLQNSHWISILIFYKKSIIQCLDSLNNKQKDIIENIQQLINYKSNFKNKFQVVYESPRQQNGYDCGVFIIRAYYQLLISKNLIKCSDYGQYDISKFRRNLLTLAIIASQTQQLNEEHLRLILE